MSRVSSVVEQMTENHRVRSSILRPGTNIMMKYLNQINLTKLFKSDYILEDFPSQNGLYVYLAVIFGLMIILVAVLKLFLIRKDKPFRNNLINMMFAWLLTVGLVGLFWIFCRYQQIQYLGSRVILLAVGAAFIIWGLIILYYELCIIPREIKQVKERQNFEKYLPRPKKTNRNMDITRSRKGK